MKWKAGWRSQGQTSQAPPKLESNYTWYVYGFKLKATLRNSVLNSNQIRWWNRLKLQTIFLRFNVLENYMRNHISSNFKVMNRIS